MRIAIYLLTLFFLSSCSKTGKHTSSMGLQYVVHHTDEKPKAIKGDILQLRFSYTTKADSLLFSSDALSDSMILQYTDMKYSQMDEALGLLGEGDSVTFIFSPDSVFQKVFNARIPAYINKDDAINWNVKLVKRFTRDEFTQVIDQRLRKTAEEEDKQINSYCLANEIHVKPTPSGLVFISFNEGEGRNAQEGDTIVVKYTARFLSGQIFDSSEDGIGAVRFVLGKNKMIKGWEEGFSYMKEKGVARFIIPSRLGYGMKGFGPVPGDTPIVYDVELTKIISNNPS